jgi:hypothetical protein
VKQAYIFVPGSDTLDLLVVYWCVTTIKISHLRYTLKQKCLSKISTWEMVVQEYEKFLM